LTVPTDYQPASAELLGVVKQIMERFHNDQFRSGAEPVVLMATDSAKPPVKWNGVETIARVRKIPQRDRAAGLGDFEVIIDKAKWEARNRYQRLAVIDEALCYVHPYLSEVTDGDGETAAFERDAGGRPRLKITPPGFAAFGFAEVIERHGVNAEGYGRALAAYQEARRAALSNRDVEPEPEPAAAASQSGGGAGP
jgi:hypothetical protein